MTEIVKVQRPVVSSDSHSPWLIYDKSRKHVESKPDLVIPKHVRDAMKNDFKAYFRGAWSSIVGWGLGERVPDQGW
jgi:hypothetical protein